jgi:hypothetical protein
MDSTGTLRLLAPGLVEGRNPQPLRACLPVDDRAEAEGVAAELNACDRHPEYGELGRDDWVVVTDYA